MKFIFKFVDLLSYDCRAYVYYSKINWTSLYRLINILVTLLFWHFKHKYINPPRHLKVRVRSQMMIRSLLWTIVFQIPICTFSRINYYLFKQTWISDSAKHLNYIKYSYFYLDYTLNRKKSFPNFKRKNKVKCGIAFGPFVKSTEMWHTQKIFLGIYKK